MKKTVVLVIMLAFALIMHACKNKANPIGPNPSTPTCTSTIKYSPTVSPTSSETGTETCSASVTGTPTVSATVTETSSITDTATCTATPTNTPGWVTAGNAGFSTGAADEISIKNFNGVMFVSYGDSGTSYPVVKTLDAGTWTDSNAPAVAGSTYRNCLYSDGSRLLWLPFYYYATDSVQTFNGTAWSGAADFPQDYFMYSVASDGTNIYACAANASDSYRLSVYKYDGSWTDITYNFSSIVNLASTTFVPSVEIFNGELYLAVRDGSSGVVVKKFNETGATWDAVGASPVVSDNSISNVTLKSDGTDLYLAFNYTGYTKPAVYRLNGASWSDLNSANICDSYSGYLAMNVHGGKPYVAYRDIYSSYKLTVKKYNGATWDPVGTAGITDGGISSVSLDFDNDGVPYVAVADDADSSKAHVFMFK